MENKGIRAKNFSQSEEELLVELVEKYRFVIENKKTGATNWTAKEKCWNKIEIEFNSDSGGTFRSVKTLKEKYYNIKKRSKQKHAENKLNVIKTGEGAYHPVPTNSIDDKVKELLGKQLEGISNPYDADAETPLSAENVHIEGIVDAGSECSRYDVEDATPDAPDGNVETITLQVIESSSGTEEDEHTWRSYSSNDLKTPTSAPLRMQNKGTTRKSKKVVLEQTVQSKKYVPIQYELIEEKLSFVRLQKEKFLEEHNLKMEVLRKQLQLVEKQLQEQ